MANKNNLWEVKSSFDEMKSQIENASNEVLKTLAPESARKFLIEYLEHLSNAIALAYRGLSALDITKIKENDYEELAGELKSIINSHNEMIPAIFKKNKIVTTKDIEVVNLVRKIGDSLAEVEGKMNSLKMDMSNPEVIADAKKKKTKTAVIAGVGVGVGVLGLGAGALGVANNMQLQNKVGGLENTNKDLQNKNDQLEIDNEALININQNYQVYFNTLNKEILKLKSEKAELEEKLKNAGTSEEVKNLQKQLDDLNVKYGELETKYNNVIDSYDTLRDENAKLLESNEGYKTKIQDLETQIDAKNTEIEALKSSKELLESEIKTKQAEIDSLNSQVKNLQDALANAGNGSGNNAEVESLRAQLKDAQDKLTIAEAEIESLKSVNKSLSDSLTQTQTERDRYYSDYLKATQDLEIANAEKEALKKENEGLKDENQGLKTENERLNNVIENYKNNGGSFDSEARSYLVHFLKNKGVNCDGKSDEDLVKLLIQYAGGDLSGPEEGGKETDNSSNGNTQNPGYGPDMGSDLEP